MINSASSEQSLLHSESTQAKPSDVNKYDILKQRLLLFLKDNEKLRDEIFDLKLNYDKEKTKAQDADQLIVTLYKQIEKLETDVSNYQDDIKHTSKKYEEISLAAGISERERKLLRQRCGDDEERITKLEKDLRDANVIATSSNKRIEELTNLYDQAKAQLELYEKQCVTLEEKLKDIEEQLVDSNKTTLIISHQFSKAEIEIDRLNTELEKNIKLRNIFENRSEQSQLEHDRLLKQIDMLENRLEQEEEVCRRLQIEMKTYERDLNSL